MKQVLLPLAIRGLVAAPSGFTAVIGSTYAYGISGRNIVGIYTISGGDSGSFRFDGTTYHTFQHPSAITTAASGIDGHNIVGFYVDDTEEQATHGFLYDGRTFTTIDNPQVPPLQTVGTFPTAIEGRNIVGYCRDLNPPFLFGFIYNGHSFQKLQHPSASNSGTFAYDICGNKVVGAYFDANGLHGYIFDGQNYQTLDHPNGTETLACGISAGKIVGSFRDANGYHGFVYDGSSFTTLDHPNATGGTFPLGIDAGNIVGYFIDGGYRGFLYDGNTYRTLDYTP